MKHVSTVEFHGLFSFLRTRGMRASKQKKMWLVVNSGAELFSNKVCNSVCVLLSYLVQLDRDVQFLEESDINISRISAAKGLRHIYIVFL